MWPNPQFPDDLVTFTEEILNGKLYFCAVCVNVNNSAFGTFYYYLLKSWLKIIINSLNSKVAII